MKKIISTFLFLHFLLPTALAAAPAGMTVDKKKILLLNAYPAIAQSLADEMSQALLIARNVKIPTQRRRALLKRSIGKARAALESADIDRDFLRDVEAHLTRVEKAVTLGDFKTAEMIVAAYDDALRRYVFVLD